MVARMVWDHDAVGSNPIISINKNTVPFGTVFLFYDDVDLNLPQALLELGSPIEQSREVLAHQRLRSVTSNKVAKSSCHLDNLSL